MSTNRIVTFGEIMGRLAPDHFYRLAQTMPGKLDFTFAGAEANVAVSIARLGAPVSFVTALPDNTITEACLDNLRSHRVDVSNILVRPEGRMGLYFVETGANQRPSRVVYDRESSTIARTPASAYDWRAIFAGTAWLHISGVTPALSEAAAEAARVAMQSAKQAGVTVSCDLNFRNKLWNWREGTSAKELAREVMPKLLQYVDVVIGNEEDASDVLDIRAGETDVHRGELEIERYPEVARRIVEQFPQVSRVAITLRESLSASHNNWRAMLYSKGEDRAHFAPCKDDHYQPYEIRNIVDRVGGGDSFAAGLVFALSTPELSEPSRAIRFAVAASCLAHSIKGDFNYSSRSEVEKLMGGVASGRVER